MMVKILLFLQRPWCQKKLFVEAYFRLGIARLSVLFLPFSVISRHLGIPMLESLPNEPRDRGLLDGISWAVQAASQYTPWNSNCLAQAIAAQRMLKYRDISSTLYLGMGRREKPDMEAHAWLRSSDTYIVGMGNNPTYSVVATYGDIERKISSEE